jgi:hypothetical protein
VAGDGREADNFAESGGLGGLELVDGLIEALLERESFRVIVTCACGAWEEILEGNIRCDAEVECLETVRCYVLRPFQRAEESEKMSR